MKKISRLFSSLSLLFVLMPSCKSSYNNSSVISRDNEKIYNDISLVVNEIQEGDNYYRYKIDVTNNGDEYAFIRENGITINNDSENDDQKSFIYLYNADNFLFDYEVLAPKDSKTYYISSYEEIKINENDKFSTYYYSLPAENATLSNTELVKSESNKYLIFKYQANNFDFKNYRYIVVVEFEYDNTKYAVYNYFYSSDNNQLGIRPKIPLESDNIKLINSKVFIDRKINNNNGLSVDAFIVMITVISFILFFVVPIAAAIIIPLSISKSRKARQAKALDNNNNDNNYEGK